MGEGIGRALAKLRRVPVTQGRPSRLASAVRDLLPPHEHRAIDDPCPRSDATVKLTLNVWRQKNAQAPGRFETYEHPDVNEHMSFLEMLDVLNQRLIEDGDEPIAFDHDCREGICGICGLMINGVAHGPERATTACQLHMRFFNDGDTITIEPWRARA